eukprot:3871721-Rhodomonas_salina.3
MEERCTRSLSSSRFLRCLSCADAKRFIGALLSSLLPCVFTSDPAGCDERVDVSASHCSSFVYVCAPSAAGHDTAQIDPPPHQWQPFPVHPWHE